MRSAHTSMNRLTWRFTAITIITCVAFLLPGCITTPVGMAPATVPISSISDYTILKDQSVSARSWGFSILELFALFSPSTEKARERAIKSAAADALIEVTVNNSSLCLPLRYVPVITIACVTVSGKPVMLNTNR